MAIATRALAPPGSPGGTDAPTKKPDAVGDNGLTTMITLWAFVTGPFAALVAAAFMSFTGQWSWAVISVVFGLNLALYLVGGFGIGAGFHRYLTHGSYEAKRGLRMALTIAGCTAVEGQPIQWVADHRCHHAYSDRQGDPHSPWRYGKSVRGLIKGLFHAQCGWFIHRQQVSNPEKFAPDLLADRDMQRLNRLFAPIALTSVLLPPAIIALIAWSWPNVLFALFWSLARMALLHHVTWSINSVCHVYGERPFETREGDRASNFWPLAIISFGESWHNLHHADPTCARHGVDKGQIDLNAWLIGVFERLGWATKVRWPNRNRLDAKRLGSNVPSIV